jgi:hypothetical protein
MPRDINPVVKIYTNMTKIPALISLFFTRVELSGDKYRQRWTPILNFLASAGGET